MTTPSPRARRCAAILGVAVAAVALGRLAAGSWSDWSLAILLALLPIVSVMLVEDLRRIGSDGALPRWPVVVVCAAPLLMSIVPDFRAVALVQLGVLALAGASFARASAPRMQIWSGIARALVIPALGFGLVLCLAYASTGVRTLGELAYPVGLLCCASVVLLPVLVVDSPARLERLVAVILLGSVVQAAVVAAQGAGLLDSLPGPLSVLGAMKWGGAITTVGAGRYPGTFGDVELLAEYASLVTILGIGLAGVSRRSPLRWIGAITAGCALVTGSLTGTRSYFVAIAIGLGVLVLMTLSGSERGRRALVMKALGLATALTAGVYALMPDGVRLAMFGRFAGLELEGPNLLNRGLLFDAWFRLMDRMPFFGFGARMLDTIRGGYSGFLIESPHSLYFWAALTAGIPGILALLVLLVAALLVLGRAWRNSAGQSRSWFGVFIALFVAWIANEYKIDAVRSPFYVDWLLFVLGLPLALAAVAPSGIEGRNP